MSFSAKNIADWFLARAKEDGEFLTQMKLQKLVYIAHGWCLAVRDEPLIDEEVEAWKWGPVIRSLYREFVFYGSDPILQTASRTIKPDGQILDVLEKVWQVYKRYTASELSTMTHKPGTPWSNFYRPETPLAIIPNDEIKKHYVALGQAK